MVYVMYMSYICMVYVMNMSCICMEYVMYIVFEYVMDMHGIHLLYPRIHDYTWIFIVYHRYINLKKGTEQTHLYYSWYIPHICIRSTYGFNIHGIYHTYTMYIQVYTTCIHHDIA